jgi:hypothetical protein
MENPLRGKIIANINAPNVGVLNVAKHYWF